MNPRDPNLTYRIMSRVPSRDTHPELVLRKALWAAGLRYRLHDKSLPGRPDIVFRKARVAVFVDGDFWHGNAWRVRELSSLADLFPTNTHWWVAKIEGNVERDQRVTAKLEETGWIVLRVWESTILHDATTAAADIARVVKARSRARRQ